MKKNIFKIFFPPLFESFNAGNRKFIPLRESLSEKE